MSAPSTLPQLTAPLFVADGGLETSLLYLHGIDLPEFAAFPLLDDAAGRGALEAYFEPYLALARTHRVGIVLDTPTWRANPDWAAALGYDRERLAALNERAVTWVRGLAAAHPEVTAVVNGAIGPRGDGYVVGETMTAAEARRYHALQVRAFARAGADMVTAVTLTYTDEAIGVAHAALEAGLPVAIGFTTETDGRLPSGVALGDAITAVDAATEGRVAYFMVNCAHPTHFAGALVPGEPWLERVKAVRANASALSHAELDVATELHRGDPEELAEAYGRLRAVLPDLRVVGGCCGTDHAHVAAITERLTAPAAVAR